MVLSDKLKRSVTLTLAALLFLASLVPLLTRQKAGAYGLLGARQIQMSSSAYGDAPDGQDADTTPDGQDVTYHVEFDLSSSWTSNGDGNIGGIVVEFCKNSPIIGDTDTGCNDISSTLNFDIGTPTVTNAGACDVDLSTWETAGAAALTAHTLEFSDGTPVAAANGDTVCFDLTGVRNPDLDANGSQFQSFYARIYIYNVNTDADGYTLADPAVVGPFAEAGGIALSTANQITITSKVQERLTFCVYTAASFTPTTDNNCTTKPSLATPGAGNTINLGDTNGVLDSAGPFVDKTAYFGITTNASGAAAVRMKGDTLRLTPSCAAANCRIEAIGGTAAVSAPNTEQFGLCAYQVDGSGLTITNAAPDYSGGTPGDCAATTQTSGTGTAGGAGTATFAFDNNNTTGTTSTYGQTIASKPAGAFSTGNLVFIGNISDTTEPGIYKTTLTFVATGTY